ncbi:DNA-binding protein SMUBP-2 [Anopheles bellator]|uniref:DNA-binding protein SMUBP-2 n=1 Tax=Anopheles bellator TaxID=139047 RepID=UPI00264917CE|nr:DNA-binding protein SMUBP-2 [Anopheles bellator]
MSDKGKANPERVASDTLEAPEVHAPALMLNTDPKVVTKASELLAPIDTDVVEKNLNTVLAAVKTVDQTCDFKGCKQKTNLVGTDCIYCRERFCFKHSLPEIHGCGEAVKRKEREEFLHPITGKARREKEDKQKAQTRLSQKLKQMSLERKQKPTGGSASSSSRGGSSTGRGKKRTTS